MEYKSRIVLDFGSLLVMMFNDLMMYPVRRDIAVSVTFIYHQGPCLGGSVKIGNTSLFHKQHKTPNHLAFPECQINAFNIWILGLN